MGGGGGFDPVTPKFQKIPPETPPFSPLLPVGHLIACMLTMLLDDTRKHRGDVAPSKRDRSNACGKVEPSEIAHLMQEAGVDPKAAWY